ncbi:SGNH/GDSL hydrolase family protein [Rhizobium sp. CG4]|uniref:SGNH/GDSL hydrolase family protein n=1 Tax=Rhizobium sp. CG4 TaxID=2726075 RepID=UPI0020336470|nr:SGNH/GDSL hydrolase family protein [Rhizobium sp. CG4]MCM2454773.1 SGNH/GDSL hydrolase family protein [Rhizobium sp. CG4]
MKSKVIRFLGRFLYIAPMAAFVSAVSPNLSAFANDTPSLWLGLVNEKTQSLEWPGSGFEIIFTGKAVSVTLEDSGKNSLVVENDGKLSKLQLARGKKTYQFVADGGGQQHTLRLIRRTEKMFGPTTLSSIKTEGTLLPGKKRNRQILAIGDSISAGYGIEGSDQSCKFSADTQNQYLTYPAVVARSVGADITTIATSGIRVSPKFPSDVTTMPFVFQQAVPKGRVFDVVIVNLGTNDFSEKTKPDNFVNAYAAFMAVIRDQSPDAMIYAALGPMLTDSQFSEASAAIEAAVKLRHQRGDGKIRFLALRTKAKGFGCNWHPNAETHARLAATLTKTLEHDLNWKRDAAN